jgi:outer membrane autotransporter protein
LTDDGSNIQRGIAVDTSSVVALPGQLGGLIQLQGTNFAGHIFGDILISPEDAIEVTNGTTFLDGNIDGFNDGTLDIFDGGKLVLCQEGWSGACDPNGWGDANYDPQLGGNLPSVVSITNFTVQSDGTIAYQLTPRTDPGTYPQVFANTANLDGTLAAQYLPGFYANSGVYDDIIVATNTLDGTFASVVDNSILLKTTADQGSNTVDLNFERVAFNKVKGLSLNQGSVGGAIENTYNKLPGAGVNPATASPYAQLVATLFTIDNAGDYGSALDQLTGAQYPQYLQSVLWSTRGFNESITDRMDCSMNGLAAAKMVGAKLDVPPTGCFTPGQLQVWARTWGAWNNNDGDINAPGYDEDQFAFWGGLDYAFTDRWFAGIAGGGFWSDMEFDRFGGVPGGTIDYDGGQIALYGGWDSDVWYNRAIVSAGFYSGDSHRFIAIKGSPLDPNGSPDSDVVSFYNEAGRRFGWWTGATVTPFAGIRIAHAELDGFTESDPQKTGAALAVSGSDADSVASVLGVRFNGTWGAVRPQAAVGWEHEFEDTFQTVNASLVGAPSGTKFKVRGTDLDEDSLLVEAGGSYLIGPSSDFSLRYVGRWLSDYDSQSIMGRFTWKWGAAPVVEAAPVTREPLKIGTE